VSAEAKVHFGISPLVNKVLFASLTPFHNPNGKNPPKKETIHSARITRCKTIK